MKLLGSHQRSWVWGRRVVLEILRANQRLAEQAEGASGGLAASWPAVELYLDQCLPPEELTAACELAEAQNTRVRVEPARHLEQLCHAADHQGHVAKMSAYPYFDAEKLLERIAPTADAEARLPLFVILDGIQDSHNFGAIVRSAEALGADAIIIGEKGQAGVNSLAVRSSAGAVARLPIARTPELEPLARQLRERGATLFAATEKAESDCSAADFRQPAAIVLGNESHGISPALLECCDKQVRVPQCGSVGSLNVAAAAAILLYEAQRQRNSKQ